MFSPHPLHLVLYATFACYSVALLILFSRAKSSVKRNAIRARKAVEVSAVALAFSVAVVAIGLQATGSDRRVVKEGVFAADGMVGGILEALGGSSLGIMEEEEDGGDDDGASIGSSTSPEPSARQSVYVKIAKVLGTAALGLWFYCWRDPEGDLL